MLWFGNIEHLNCGTYALLLSIWLTVSPCDVSYSIVGGQGPAVLIVSETGVELHGKLQKEPPQDTFIGCT